MVPMIRSAVSAQDPSNGSSASVCWPGQAPLEDVGVRLDDDRRVDARVVVEGGGEARHLPRVSEPSVVLDHADAVGQLRRGSEVCRRRRRVAASAALAQASPRPFPARARIGAGHRRSRSSHRPPTRRRGSSWSHRRGRPRAGPAACSRGRGASAGDGAAGPGGLVQIQGADDPLAEHGAQRLARRLLDRQPEQDVVAVGVMECGSGGELRRVGEAEPEQLARLPPLLRIRVERVVNDGFAV